MPVYERDEWHVELQARAGSPYPVDRAQAIVSRNLPWVQRHPFSFRNQTEKAVERHDMVSVDHRLVAGLARYFDIVFALNRVLHHRREAACPSGPRRVCDAAQRLR